MIVRLWRRMQLNQIQVQGVIGIRIRNYLSEKLKLSWQGVVVVVKPDPNQDLALETVTRIRIISLYLIDKSDHSGGSGFRNPVVDNHILHFPVL